MSEVGILSKQYEQLVDTIDEINASVICLKRASCFAAEPVKYSQFRVHEEAQNQAVSVLSPFIDYLINLFNNRHEPDYRFIPEKVLDKFRGSFEHEEDLKGQFRSIAKLIRSGKLPDAEQFELLDRIVTTLDMERNKLSKKIRSARG